MDGEWFFLVIILICFLSDSDSNVSAPPRGYEPPPFDWDEWHRKLQYEIDLDRRDSDERAYERDSILDSFGNHDD